MADDREAWWGESMEALSALPLEPITPMKLFHYDPTPATDPPFARFAEGATKGYLVLRSMGQAYVADAVVLRDADGDCFFEQTSELRPTTIVEDADE